MQNIADRVICLKLNQLWKPVNTQAVGKTICDLVTGVVDALDIVYPLGDDGKPDFSMHDVRPVAWEEWVTLPVFEWQPSIKTLHGLVRVPTVVVAKKYSDMPKKEYRGKPTKEGLFFRDKGRDAYTGKLLDWDDATIDHVIPLGRGGLDTYENTVLTNREVNNWKGHRLNKEIRRDAMTPEGVTIDSHGLRLIIVPTRPKKVDVARTIRKAQHIDWRHYLVNAEVVAA
jgi:hypothetical protein